jgi:bifunctional enzyme CysN/CysC
VIVDNYEISGGGIVLESIADTEGATAGQASENRFLWDKSSLLPHERERVFQHKPKFIVITSASDADEKVIHEIAREVEKKLFFMRCNVYYLGISSLLNGLDWDSASGHEGRDEHIRVIGELARLLTDSGQIFITAIFRLDDFEAEKLKAVHNPNEILLITAGESPLSTLEPDARVSATDLAGAVETVCELLKSQEILLEYYL